MTKYDIINKESKILDTANDYDEAVTIRDNTLYEGIECFIVRRDR